MSRPAADDYERVYGERLWSLVPGVYRDEDGREPEPGVLRAFVEAVASDLAVVRRSVDRLGEDAFVETADGWALPYLGDLVATRLVSALNERGRRVDVAKTIHYRRRKGTPRVLEELIADITGWDGVVVEHFRRLGRHRHGLDPEPDPLRGRVTGTRPGGWADLRSARGAELADTAFDEYHHTPDVRRHRGLRGRHGVPKLAVRIFRLPAWPLVRVTPGPGPDAGARTIDPSGRDVPLFQRRGRPADFELWRSAREWEVAGPMRCRALGDADFLVTDEVVATLEAAVALPATAAADLRRFVGVCFDGERRLRTAVRSLPAASSAAILGAATWRALLAAALAPDCGKAALVPGSLELETAPGTAIERERIAAGDLEAWTTPTTGVRVVVDSERGRARFIGGPPAAGLTVTHHVGFPGPIGAGPWDRSAALEPPDTTLAGGGAIAAGAILADGVTRIGDSLSYTGIPNETAAVRLVLHAADRQRPYVRLGADWVLDSGANSESVATIDGIWLGAGAAPRALVLRGDFERVTLRHTTLDPGGADALGRVLAPVSLVVEGAVELLELDHAICGPVRVAAGAAVERVLVRDSIVHAAGQAIDAPRSELEVERSTVIGRVGCARLHASELLAAGRVDVTDIQQGCFRFSAAPRGSRLPRPYESHVLDSAAGLFTSLRFGDPGYTQLAHDVTGPLARAAEDTSEIGAWSSLRNPIRFDGLRAKVDEYAPFGLVPFYVFDT
jgi:hypothetical protein